MAARDARRRAGARSARGAAKQKRRLGRVELSRLHPSFSPSPSLCHCSATRRLLPTARSRKKRQAHVALMPEEKQQQHLNLFSLRGPGSVKFGAVPSRFAATIGTTAATTPEPAATTPAPMQPPPNLMLDVRHPKVGGLGNVVTATEVPHDATVGDLTDALRRNLGFEPTKKFTLLFAGTRLSCPTEPLDDLGIRSGHQIMLVQVGHEPTGPIARKLAASQPAVGNATTTPTPSGASPSVAAAAAAASSTATGKIKVCFVTQRKLELPFTPDMTVIGLKRLLEAKGEGSPASFRLFYAGKELQDSLALGHYKVVDGASVQLTLRTVPISATSAAIASGGAGGLLQTTAGGGYGGASGSYGKREGRFVGLRNQGATCYLNSLIQSLYMTPDFRDAVSSLGASDGAGTALPKFTGALVELFASLTHAPSAVSTEALTTALSWGPVSRQQDVHEFWTLLCERLETDLKGTEHAKMVEALFEGEQRDYVRCHECGTVSYRKDQFRDLKLVVPEEKKPEAPTAVVPFSGAGHTLSGATTTTAAAAAAATTAAAAMAAATTATATTASSTATTTASSTATSSTDTDGPSAAGNPANEVAAAAAKAAAPAAAQRADVQSGLREMLQPEQMNGDEQYSCDCCGRKTDAERGVELTKLPKILTVQLKRFGFDFRTHARHKVNTPFAFDTTLDMSPFVAAVAAEQKQQQPEVEGGKGDASPRSGTVAGGTAGGSTTAGAGAAAAMSTTPGKASAEAGATAADSPTSTLTSTLAPSSPSVPAPPHTDVAVDVTDAAVPDAAVPDAAVPDAYMPDAAMPDADTLDAARAAVVTRGDLEEGCARGKAAAGTDDSPPPPPPNLQYELYAVLVHSGSASFGHYYALIKDVGHGEWHEFNDSLVKPIKESELQRAWGSAAATSGWSSSSSAYMLLYRQKLAPAAEQGGLVAPRGQKAGADQVTTASVAGSGGAASYASTHGSGAGADGLGRLNFFAMPEANGADFKRLRLTPPRSAAGDDSGAVEPMALTTPADLNATGEAEDDLASVNPYFF